MFADSVGREVRYGELPPGVSHEQEVKLSLALFRQLSEDLARAETTGATGGEVDVSRLRAHLEMLRNLYESDLMESP